MRMTDGLIVRCPECGMLNILLNEHLGEGLVSCMNCEGSINPNSAYVYKQSSGLIP